MKKILMFITLTLVLVGCSKEEAKYSNTFYDTFDTQIMYLEYNDSEKEYEENYQFVVDEFTRLHKLYDNYRSYEGVNNISTVNEKAGKEAVIVDEDLFNLVEYSIEQYDKTLGYTNIAMGKVLKIWSDVREHNEGLEDADTIIPDQAELEEADKYSNIENIELNRENLTIFIKDENTQIDLGAVAKGYATEIVADKLVERGVNKASINAGGNVRTIGNKPDGTDWGIALQNPDVESSDYLDVLYLEGSESVVTSGDYQRFFMHDGKRYHHLINPKTLWPENRYRAVSIVTEDSGLADVLSTALYLATEEEGQEILKNYEEEIGAMWVTDDSTTNTPNLDDKMSSKGATNK